MLKKDNAIHLITLFGILFLLSQINCENGNQGPGPGPVGNGTPTGGWNTSPEDSIVQILLNEFEDQKQIEPRITFFDGNITGFLKTLDSLLNQFGHLDYVGFYSNDLDVIITQNWLKPYPGSINENDFLSEAIDGMKHNNILYGIPIYIKDGEVKGVGISSRLESELENTAVELIDHVTNSENSSRIVTAVGGTSARNLPDLLPVPDSFGFFCVLDDSGLVVTVENRGLRTSPAFMTEVDFFNKEKISVRTPELRPNESIELHFEIPPNCFNPDCRFQITVDSEDEVNEDNEENNIVFGNCLG